MYFTQTQKPLHPTASSGSRALHYHHPSDQISANVVTLSWLILCERMYTTQEEWKDAFRTLSSLRLHIWFISDNNEMDY